MKLLKDRLNLLQFKVYAEKFQLELQEKKNFAMQSVDEVTFFP